MPVRKLSADRDPLHVDREHLVQGVRWDVEGDGAVRGARRAYG
jgi:hypothetical protein